MMMMTGGKKGELELFGEGRWMVREKIFNLWWALVLVLLCRDGEASRPGANSQGWMIWCGPGQGVMVVGKRASGFLRRCVSWGGLTRWMICPSKPRWW